MCYLPTLHQAKDYKLSMDIKLGLRNLTLLTKKAQYKRKELLYQTQTFDSIFSFNFWETPSNYNNTEPSLTLKLEKLKLPGCMDCWNLAKDGYRYTFH